MRKNKIRILHVAQAAGGVDRYIRMLLKYMDKEKFENILVCSQDFHEEDYRGLADSFEQVEMTRDIGSHDLKAIKKIRVLIKRYNPDIVYAHSSKAGAIARVADIGLKNRCVYNPHGWAFNMRCSAKKKAMYTAIEKVAAPFCNKIICISDAEKQSALDNKICKEDKLQVIFNGVDIEAYENGVHGAVKRREMNIPEDAFVVGMVGRMSPQKAPDVFIKMAKQVKEKVPNAHFIIVGNGSQEAEIRKYAEENGFSDSLYITGWVDNPMSYVELFDVACLLSRWEGFGSLIGISEFVNDSFRKQVPTLRKEQCYVLKNGVDTVRFTARDERKIKEYKNKYGIKDNDFVVIFAGRLVGEKGALETIKAIKECKDEHIKLLIVGAGFYSSDIIDDYTLELQKEAEGIKDRIVFTGYIDYKDMPSVYQLGNVAVLPSMWEEPAGMTMVEAVVSGLPLITTNSGGIPEYIPAELAYMLDRNKDLVKNISWCILQIKNSVANNATLNTVKRNKFIEEIGLEKYFEGFEYILKKG